jgi:hypothetical protein
MKLKDGRSQAGSPPVLRRLGDDRGKGVAARVDFGCGGGILRDMNSARGRKIVESLRKAKKRFGASCPCPKKFGGAAAVETLRAELKKEGIKTSRRDVFIKGFPSEIDLIVPRKKAKPLLLDLLYEPEKVSVALEVKKSGSFGKQGIVKIKNDFKGLRRLGVKCAYVTFEDRKNYRWRPTRDRLDGFRCFALAWHKKTDGPLEPTENSEGWEALVKFLRNEIAARRGG